MGRKGLAGRGRKESLGLAVTEPCRPTHSVYTRRKGAKTDDLVARGPRLNKAPKPRSQSLTLLVCRLHHAEVGQKSLWV